VASGGLAIDLPFWQEEGARQGAKSSSFLDESAHLKGNFLGMVAIIRFLKEERERMGKIIPQIQI
jgi:hypothetical protein